MSAKKLENILNLIEIAENNLRTARSMLSQMTNEKSGRLPASGFTAPAANYPRSNEEERAMEIVEGYFDGESMIGDNGQIYLVPPNYASKTQLVVGDRMKWILTPEREVFKLIQPVARERVIGTFAIEGDNYVVLINEYPNPVKILKASATFAMKNLGLQVGDEVAVFIPKEATPTWGAFSSVVKTQNLHEQPAPQRSEPIPAVESPVDEFKLEDLNIESSHDFF